MFNENYTIKDAKTLTKDMIDLAFNDVWSGGGAVNLTNNLLDDLSILDTEIVKANQYFYSCYLLNQYIANCSEIDSLNMTLYTLFNTKKNQSRRSSLKSSISNLEAENSKLRKKILDILSGITKLGIGYKNIIPSINPVQQIKIDKLYSAYKNNNFRQLRNENLGDYYNDVDKDGNVIPGSGQKKIEAMVEEIRNTYSGREAAVNTGLLLLHLAAMKGVKLQYENRGTKESVPYVPTSAVLTGVDCNPFVSYLVDKGTPGGFQWRPVQSFPGVGEGIPYDDWSKAQPGDVMSNGRHVAMIVENDPVNKRFITMEARSHSEGIVMYTRTYQECKGDYYVRDMTGVYNGEIDTNRNEAFGL